MRPFYEFLAEFSHSLPPEYRERHDARAISDHARLAYKKSGAVSVGSFRTSEREGLPVCVIADDAPGLLSRISAAFVLSKLDVIDAEAYCRTTAGADQAVDLFWVRHRDAPGDVVWIGPEELARFNSVLVVLIDGTQDVQSLIEHAQGSEKPAAFAGTRLSFVVDAAGQIAGLDVETQDRSGLLFRLSSALFAQRLQIVRSEVRTIGRRVFDRFHFRELDGSPVSQKRADAIEAEVLSALTPPYRLKSRGRRELFGHVKFEAARDVE